MAGTSVGLVTVPGLARGGAVLPRVTVDEATRRTEDLIDCPWVLHAYGDVFDGERTLTGFDGSPLRVRLSGDAVVAEGSQQVDSVVVRHD